MFKVQRSTSADPLPRLRTRVEFYSTVSGFWDVPGPTRRATTAAAAGSPQPPYYLLADNPAPGGAQQPDFQLTSVAHR